MLNTDAAGSKEAASFQMML